MDSFHLLLTALGSLVLMVGFGLLLRYCGVLKAEDGRVCSGIFMNLVLPAMIFSTLARQPVDSSSLRAALIMLVILLLVMAISAGLATLLRLNRKQTGSFVMVTTFASATTLGLSLVEQTFPSQATALEQAVVISQFGVMVPALILGAAAAIWYGHDGNGQGGAALAKDLLGFFKSPVFLSILAGIAMSLSGGHESNPLAGFLVEVADRIGQALFVFVGLSISLMLRPVEIGFIWKPVLASCLLKLVVEPVLVVGGAAWFGMAAGQREILLLEAALPASSVAAILAVRYGCDAAMASTLMVAGYFVGLITVPALYYLLG